MTDRELAGCAPDEKGPFRVVEHEGGRISVASDDFTHDVWLRVTGDFGSEAVHRHYAEWVAATLNAALSTPSSEGDGRDAARYRWLRDLPDGSPYECIGNMPGDRWDDEIDAGMKEQQ